MLLSCAQLKKAALDFASVSSMSTNVANLHTTFSHARIFYASLAIMEIHSRCGRQGFGRQVSGKDPLWMARLGTSHPSWRVSDEAKGLVFNKNDGYRMW